MAVDKFEEGCRYRYYYNEEDEPDDFFEFIVTEIRPNRYDPEGSNEVWGEEEGFENEVHCVNDSEEEREQSKFIERIKAISYEPEDWS